MKKKYFVSLFASLLLVLGIGCSLSSYAAEEFSEIQLGDKNDSVTEIQEILIDAGYLNANATGYFGDLTEQAVKDFQAANGLEETGIVDSSTYSLLLEESSENYTTDIIISAQEALSEAGYDCGSADGVINSQTATAIEKYQTHYGLTVTGEIDDELLSALGVLEGVPLGAFIVRYNEAADYYNSLADYGRETGDSDWGNCAYVTEEMVEASDAFSPNANLSITLNYGIDSDSNDMIMTIYAASDDSSAVDTGLGIGELICIIYAFDTSVKDPSDTTDLISDLQKYLSLENNNVSYVCSHNESFYLSGKYFEADNMNEAEIETDTEKTTGFADTYIGKLEELCGDDSFVRGDYYEDDGNKYCNILFDNSVLITVGIAESSKIVVVDLNKIYSEDYATDYMVFLVYAVTAADDDLTTAMALAILHYMSENDLEYYTYNDVLYNYDGQKLGIVID